MRVEGIEFKRCCCCFPLRPGLLAFGYIELVYSLLCLGSSIEDFITTIYHPGRKNFSTFLTLGLLTVILLANTALTVVFIIGCHKKNARLLKLFNYYSMVLCVLTTLIMIMIILYFFMCFAMFYGPIVALQVVKIYIAAGMINTALQVYLIFLTRSEIKKLEGTNNFSFSNHAANPACSMIPETAGNFTDISDQVLP